MYSTAVCCYCWQLLNKHKHKHTHTQAWPFGSPTPCHLLPCLDLTESKNETESERNKNERGIAITKKIQSAFGLSYLNVKRKKNIWKSIEYLHARWRLLVFRFCIIFQSDVHMMYVCVYCAPYVFEFFFEYQNCQIFMLSERMENTQKTATTITLRQTKNDSRIKE